MVQHPKCRSFVQTIEELRAHTSPADAIEWLMDTQPGLIRQQDEDEPIKWIDSLIASARDIRRSRNSSGCGVDHRASKKPQDDALCSHVTIHRSKGLEYQTVFVVGLAEGLLPHQKSLTGEALREETGYVT